MPEIHEETHGDLNIHHNLLSLSFSDIEAISPNLSALLRNLSNGRSLHGSSMYSERSMSKTVIDFTPAALWSDVCFLTAKIPSRMHGVCSDKRLARGEVHGLVIGVFMVSVLCRASILNLKLEVKDFTLKMKTYFYLQLIQ